MTRTVDILAGPQACPAGRPGPHATAPPAEIPIPFGAFAAAAPPELELLSDTVDGAVRARPVRRAPSAGEPLPTTDVVALPGRVIIALGPPMDGPAGSELLATCLTRRLSRGSARLTQVLRQHAPAHDVEHWAQVDVVRATLVADLDITVCAHDLPDRPGRQLVTVDAPERHADRVIAAAGRIRGVEVAAVLTDQGWARKPRHEGADGSVADVRDAVHRHALRCGGQALVFPGQHVLRQDVPVAAVLALSAVDAVSSVHGDHAEDAVLRCHGYARPRFRNGSLTLAVAHDDPRLVVAVEVRYAPPCCGGDH